MTARSGHCLCGAIKFKATPKPQDDGAVHVDACHCGMCRRQIGGPLMGVTLDGRPWIEDETDLGVYDSSEWAQRLFCKRCGTNLFYRLKDGSMYTAHAGTFDDLSDMKFMVEIFIDDKPDYYDFAQPTQKLTGQQVMALFAGGGEAN